MPFEIPFADAAFTLHPLGPGFVAEIRGLDLGRAQPELVLEALHDAVIAHGVVLLRGQRGGIDSLARFALRLAATEQHALATTPVAAFLPARVRASLRPASTEGWRSIGSAEAQPATLALACEGSGRIAFADQQAAAAGLPPALRERIAAMRSLQSDPATGARAEWPLLRQHPLTGAALLAANPARSARVLNLPAGESTALLARLHDAATAPALVWAHEWAAGDVLVWDNRRCLHEGSVGSRFVLDGDTPVPAESVTWSSAG